MDTVYPFKCTGMPGETADLLLDIYQTLQSKYTIEVDFDFQLVLNKYCTFCDSDVNTQGTVFKVNNGGRQLYLCFPEAGYRGLSGRSGGHYYSENQVWGYCKLKSDYGRIWIKNETILDKIHDLINPVDVNFNDDEVFSKKFWVASEDKDKARNALTPDLRNFIKQIALPEPMIEMNGTDCIAGQKRVVTKDATLEIASFLDKLLLRF
jgi:hypothetical protein